LVVAQRNGQLIRLAQVADVKDTAVEARSLALYTACPESASTSPRARA